MSIRELDKLSGVDFEFALEAPLKAIGFNNISFTPKSADFGADILTTKDNEKWAIQVKRSTSPVAIGAIQEILGGMVYYGSQRGMVITNHIFTPAAIELANRANIELISRDQLKQWLSKLKLNDKLPVVSPFPYQDVAISVQMSTPPNLSNRSNASNSPNRSLD